jgi:hypothetical protein
MPVSVSMRDGGLPTVLESVAAGGVEQGTELAVGKDVDWLLGHRRRPHAFHGGVADLAALDQPAEQLLQR